ncbi:hypothetical protein QJQ45_019389 [Haematococcus lacustris]|nr:hypothetical protein QJQ45_019389 [Haematococcus lacustris]
MKYVDNTDDQLSDLFQQYGQVEDAFIPTGKYRRGAAKNAAASLNNTDYQGRTIRVNEAAPPGESRGGGGGGYGAPRRDNYGGGGGYGGGGYGGGGGEWFASFKCVLIVAMVAVVVAMAVVVAATKPLPGTAQQLTVAV